MARRQIQLRTRGTGAVPPAATDPTAAALARAFASIRHDLGVPGDFPAQVLAEADAAAAAAPHPDRDDTDAAFLTLDPPGSMDLDQAMLIERDGSGYRVRYAIADVPAFVRSGGAVDAEARRRGQTIYLPDRRALLHPASLSEGAASLLPGQVRPALIWDLRLDSAGDEYSADLYRALVRSADRLDYEGVQRQIDTGTADERLLLLAEVGRKRVHLEQERGGASLPMPEQEVTRGEDGRYALRFRPPQACEDWNAHISLMTGMAAAAMMLNARIGILRTMPEADPNAVARFRRQARARGVPWPAEMLYGDFLRTLDREEPHHLALIHDATGLFRGAGYTPFDGDVPEQTMHAAVAAPYAHVTAPLRRLVDRFGLVICETLCRDAEVPDWVREALPLLPKLMADSDHQASRVEHACTDAVEAAVLSARIGQTFPAAVVDVSGQGVAMVQIDDPAVLAPCEGYPRLGERVPVRLIEADIAARSVRFAALPDRPMRRAAARPYTGRG